MAQLERAVFVNKLTGDKHEVMFNPTEVSVKKTVPWDQQEKPGKDMPKQQFTAGQARSISMKLDFDTSGLEGDGPDAISVMDYINPLLLLAHVPADDAKAYPPLVDFLWGSGLKFTCVVKSMNVTYTRFNPDGVPTRANMQIELIEVNPADYGYAAASSEDVTIEPVQEGQPIDTQTADQNNVDNPKDPPPFVQTS